MRGMRVAIASFTQMPPEFRDDEELARVHRARGAVAPDLCSGSRSQLSMNGSTLPQGSRGSAASVGPALGSC